LRLRLRPSAAFSIVGLVWRPGQRTRIHDHSTWCVSGVIQGVEHEKLFGAELNLTGRSDNHIGDVNGFAPPGTSTASMTPRRGDRDLDPRSDGTDVTRTGSSARRYYD
jgi:predicted metal-dependent enzyme (double-stranded beta helix superfamily)